MQTKILAPRKALNKAYQRQKPFRKDFDNFKEKMKKFLDSLDSNESEEYNKKFAAEFFEKTFYLDNLVNTSGKIDLAIYLGKDAKSRVGVIGEVKAPSEKSDMPSKDNLNAKAMHQVMLYYLRERIEEKNDDIKSIFITSGYEWFIFDAKLFERIFYKNSELVKRYKAWAADKKVSSNTDHFYKEIASDFLNNLDAEIEFVHFDLRKYEKELKSKSGDERKLISLYKVFSKPFLLKEQFTNDSNSLDISFYNELLYIIGLEEVKEGSKKLIRRKDEEKRDPGSILENTIEKLKSKDTLAYFEEADKFGDDNEERLFNIALQLNITWINRILFLKLLEAQLVNYHQGDEDYKFLNTKIIAEYDDLDELFHEVLARKLDERSVTVREKFKKIPYLNSSLFERSELERNTLFISELKDRFKINVHPSTVLKDEKDNRFKGELSTLKYLLKFLDAYDFSTESTGEEIQEEGKSLINASVLGLIFEKINGYKEGSFFTPGFITMYMSRETLRRSVVQKFNDALNNNYKDFEELKSEIDRTKKGREKANEIINTIKVCDPAVGSGHFLVSVLNEIIAIKSELGVLCYRDGSRVQNYSVEIENDELIITDVETEDIFKYHLNQKGNVIDELQRMQETIFHEKQTIIENCLFGVDINPNSVNICRLRLWIELLKNAYYTKETNYKELETLPNIDINIKQGNSLISRFELGDQVFTKGDKTSLELYKMNVKLYKNATDRNERRKLKDSIDRIRERIKGIYVDPLKEEKKKLRNMQGELDELQTQISSFEDEKLEEKKEKLEKKIDKLGQKINQQEKENELIYRDAFEWRFEFPEVLDEEGNFEGFDVVIGNPPYIRAEEIKLSREYYKTNYSVDSKAADIFYYFNELGYKLLRESYYFCFINNTYERTTAGQSLRRFMKDNFKFHEYLDFTNAVVFEEATTYPIVLIAEKSKESATFKYIPIPTDYDQDYLDNYTDYILVDQKSLLNEGWQFQSKSSTNIFNKFRKLNTLRKKYGKTYYGIKTSLNEAFIYSKPFGYDEIEKEVLEGKDIKKWKAPSIEKYLLVFDSGFTKRKLGDLEDEAAFENLKKEYPEVMSYLSQFKERAMKRYDKGEYWWELRNCAYYNKFSKSKIIFPNLQNSNKFAWDDTGKYLCAPAVFLPTEDKFLLGILNSRLVWFFLKSICVVRRGGYIEVKPQYFEQIPVPVISSTDKNQLTNLVDQILTAKKENPEANTSALEREIDELVYKLYGLTEDEIKIVEESVG